MKEREILGKANQNLLDVDRPSHGRRFHSELDNLDPIAATTSQRRGFTPSSRHRFRPRHRRLHLLSRRLHLRLLPHPHLVLVADEHRQQTGGQEGLSRGYVDVFHARAMVRLGAYSKKMDPHGRGVAEFFPKCTTLAIH